MKHNVGFVYAFAAYAWWGVIPIFWKQLDHIESIEIVMHRMIWSCMFVALLVVVSRQWRDFTSLLSQPFVMLRLLVASALISTNWAVFIWAVNTDQLVEASLGYFMNPLISIAIGVALFGEELRRGQFIALVIALVGVIYMFLTHGSFPWISLVLAITFSLYSAVKKSVNVAATHGMGIETMFLFIPALIYLGFTELQGNGQFFASTANALMLILGGLFTLIPLLLFAVAAKRISLTALGMTQYVGPTMQLLIGVLLYSEPFDAHKAISFGLIWLALGVYSIDQLKLQFKHQR